MFFDLYFFYNNFIRTLWPLKFRSFSQIFLLPFLRLLFLFFPVRRLELLEHPKIFNYVYLFSFFFGRKSVVVNYSSFFNLGRNYFNFNLGAYFSRALSFFMPLTFLIYELQPFLNLNLSSSFNFSSPNVFTWSLWDLNIFTEKKTNVGLFDLMDPLHFRFFFKAFRFSSRAFTHSFLQSLKLQFS